jgi:hypothetical protein
MTDEYLAGLIDGEGCFSAGTRLHPNRGNPYLEIWKVVVISMGTEEPLRSVQAAFGGSLKQQANGMWNWRLQRSADVIALCERLLPHLILKKEQCRLMLEMAALQEQSRPRGHRHDEPRQLEIVSELKTEKAI